jgi:hypothetical protein
MPPVAPTGKTRLTIDGEGASLRAPVCIPSSKRGRASRLFRKIKSRARHSAKLRPGVPVAISKFFSQFFCPAKGRWDPIIPSAFWVHSYAHRGPASDAIIESNGT